MIKQLARCIVASIPFLTIFGISTFADGEKVVQEVTFIQPDDLIPLKERRLNVTTTRSWRSGYSDFRLTKIDLPNKSLTGQTVDNTIRTLHFDEILYFRNLDKEPHKLVSSVAFGLLQKEMNQVFLRVVSRESPFEIAEARLVGIVRDRERLRFEIATGTEEIAFTAIEKVKLHLATPLQQDTVVHKDELRPWKIKVIDELIAAISPVRQRGLRAQEQSTQPFDANRRTRVDIDQVARNRDRLYDARMYIRLGTLKQHDADLDAQITKRASQLKRQDELARSQHTPFMLEELKRRQQAIGSQLRFIRDRGDRGRMLAELDRYEKAEAHIKAGTLEEEDAELYKVLKAFADKAAEGYVDQQKRK